jgi:hypothetical protein
VPLSVAEALNCSLHKYSELAEKISLLFISPEYLCKAHFASSLIRDRYTVIIIDFIANDHISSGRKLKLRSLITILARIRSLLSEFSECKHHVVAM